MAVDAKPVGKRASGPRPFYKDDSGDPLRENFYRFLLRSYLRAKTVGQGTQAYFAIVRTLHQFCAESWVQGTVYPGETAVVRRFLKATGLPVKDAGAFVQRSLATHACARVFGETLRTIPKEEFSALCSVTGKEHLLKALASGRGVVVVHTHTLLAELFWSWLEHEGIAPGMTLWQWTFGKDRAELSDPKKRAIDSARELHAAMGVLREGGLVHSMADGPNGVEKIELPILRRLRPYRTGFATLALRANALVITAEVFLASNGSLAIVIGQPFVDLPPDRDHAQRLDKLIGQFAAHHLRVLKARPANIPWFQMKAHMRFSPAP